MQRGEKMFVPDESWELALRGTLGYLPPKIYSALVKLGIPDMLASGPKTCEQLAGAILERGILGRVDLPSLRRVLMATVTLGRDEEKLLRSSDSLFELGPVGRWYCAGIEGSLRDRMVMGGIFDGGYHADILHVLETGGPGFPKTHGGLSFWDYLKQNPGTRKEFHAGLSGDLPLILPAVFRACDFSQFRNITDIGGGYGGFLAGILRAYPNLFGTLFDQASLMPDAKKHLEAMGVLERCEVIEGSFFEEVPRGGERDLFVLFRVLHDWRDPEFLQILENLREAMGVGARLLIVETGLRKETALFDVHLLLTVAGRLRTENDYKKLLGRSEFVMTNFSWAGNLAIVEA